MTSQVTQCVASLAFQIFKDLCVYMWVSEYFILFSIFIDCIGVTLVNEIIQVSGAQFCNTLSVHCVVCSPPQVRSPSVTIYSPSPPLPPPSPLPGNHHTVVCVHLGSSGGGVSLLLNHPDKFLPLGLYICCSFPRNNFFPRY